MGYEVTVDLVKIHVNLLLSKPVDSKVRRFGTCEEESSQIKQELQVPIMKRRVRKMIDTIDKKYESEASGATTSIGASEKIGVTLAKNEELIGGKKKVSKTKPKGTIATKSATYSKEKDLGTLVSSPSKDRLVGLIYTRKKKSDTKLKKDEKEGDITDTLSDVETNPQ